MMKTSRELVIALGSNVDAGEDNIVQACLALRQKGDLHDVSSIVCTKAMTPCPQYHYLNAAIVWRTSLSPIACLGYLQQLEASFGRQRSGLPWQSRPLDLDLIASTSLIPQQLALQCPHPRAHCRPFVLVPMQELRLPALIHHQFSPYFTLAHDPSLTYQVPQYRMRARLGCD